MFNAGMVRPGSKVWIPINTFDSNDPSASVTATTWLNTDCHIHKDGGTTQRASSAGETLSLNFDSITGNHLLEIDTADNTTANFYEAGSTYHVRIEGVTVDAGNINAWIGTFSIGYPNAILNTTIATLSSQTSFTLEDGAAEADVYNGCPVVIHDLASGVQMAIGLISDYAVTTKTVTLLADPGIFTMAAGDSISVFMPSNATWFGSVAQAGDGSNLTETGGDGAQLTEAGATGDHLTAIPWNAAWDAEVESEVDDALGAAGADLTAIPWNAAWDAEVESEVNDALDTAISELAQGIPTATPTLRTGLMLMYMALRNKFVVQTSGTDAIEIYNDAGTLIVKKLITDDGSDYTEAEAVSGA